MKNLFKNFKNSTLVLLGLGVFSAAGLSGCATSGDANLGKIGPDYDNPQMKQLELQESQSRVTRSLIR